MKVRVREDSPHSLVTAFGGVLYVRNEWRLVPDDREDEARRHPYLESLPPELDASPVLPVNLGDLTKKNLQAMAADVDGYTSRLNKARLIDLLKDGK